MKYFDAIIIGTGHGKARPGDKVRGFGKTIAFARSASDCYWTAAGAGMLLTCR
jgi:hypothetical protein